MNRYDSGNTHRYSMIFFWATALLLLFWSLGNRSLWGPEGRWAEITREMFLRGDFFHPTIKSRPYFDKPLLSYWLIALVSYVTGHLNEWSVRIPSALSGIFALSATISMGRRLWSYTTGRTAGWLLLTTYGILYWGRVGTADMENLAAVTLAVAWYWTQRNRPGFFTFFVFYLICFTGAHTKGLTAVVVPILLTLPDVIREERWKSWLSFPHFSALSLCVLLYLLPFVYAAFSGTGYQENGLLLVFRENILRFFRPFDHQNPPYIYLYYLPLFFLPWAPLLLTALGGTLASWNKIEPVRRRFLEGILLTFLFFTLSGSRRSYYILPLLPFSALFVASYFQAAGQKKLKRAGIAFQSLFLMILIGMEILTPVFWPYLKDRVGFIPPAGLQEITFLIGILSFLPWLLRFRSFTFPDRVTGLQKELIPLVLSAVILMGGFFCLQQQTLEVFRSERLFARALSNRIATSPPKEVAFYRVVSPKVLFYLDQPRPVRVLKDPGEIQQYLRPGNRPKLLVARRGYIKDILPLLPDGISSDPVLAQEVLPWQKKGNAKWKGSEKWAGKLVAWEIPGKTILPPP